MPLTQPSIDFSDYVDKDRREANPTRWHPPQVGLFSGPPVTGDELKEKGMKASTSTKPSLVYRDHLIEALKIFSVRDRITVEQLTGIVGRPEIFGAPSNCVGSIINIMAKRNLIRKTGRMIKPGRKERHSNEVAEWEVVKYA